MRRRGLLLLASAGLVGLVAAPGAASAGGGDVEVIEAWDKCEPASFNAAIGPGTCIEEGGSTPWGRYGPGDVTFEEFLDKLNPDDFGHRAWRFKSDETGIDRGDTVKVVNLGGEFHTYTEVEDFGPGCLHELNEPLGLHGPPAADCGEAFATTMIPPGGTMTVSDLSPGTHRFICVIHPWMTSEVEVRR